MEETVEQVSFSRQRRAQPLEVLGQYRLYSWFSRWVQV